MHCSAVQCSVVHCTVGQHSVVQCGAVQCSAVYCSVLQGSKVQQSAMPQFVWEHLLLGPALTHGHQRYRLNFGEHEYVDKIKNYIGGIFCLSFVKISEKLNLKTFFISCIDSYASKRKFTYYVAVTFTI